MLKEFLKASDGGVVLVFLELAAGVGVLASGRCLVGIYMGLAVRVG